MLSVIERCVSEQQIKARYVVVTLSVPYFKSVPPCRLRQARGANSAKFSFTAQTWQSRGAALCRTLSDITPTTLSQTSTCCLLLKLIFPKYTNRLFLFYMRILHNILYRVWLTPCLLFIIKLLTDYVGLLATRGRRQKGKRTSATLSQMFVNTKCKLIFWK